MNKRIISFIPNCDTDHIRKKDKALEKEGRKLTHIFYILLACTNTLYMYCYKILQLVSSFWVRSYNWTIAFYTYYLLHHFNSITPLPLLRCISTPLSILFLWRLKITKRRRKRLRVKTEIEPNAVHCFTVTPCQRNWQEVIGQIIWIAKSGRKCVHSVIAIYYLSYWGLWEMHFPSYERKIIWFCAVTSNSYAFEVIVQSSCDVQPVPFITFLVWKIFQ